MADLLLVLAALAAACSGMPGLFADRRGAGGPPASGSQASWSQGLATGLLVLASLLGAGALVSAAFSATPALFPDTLGRWVGLDAVQAWFLVPLLVLPPLGALYGHGYWPQAEHPQDAKKLRLFYGVMVGAMILLVASRHAVVFLAAWELMALGAFFLVTTEDDDPAVQQAGWHYLVATHAGTLCLFAVFALLRQLGGLLDLNHVAPGSHPELQSVIFLLALAGFGLKAGFVPLHVWLPGAHANAPSHVSALLSGVMLKMGVLGLVRVTGLLPDVQAWWGWLLLAMGMASASYGIAMAIGQTDLKRVLAYSSVENLGIVALGLGLGLLGRHLEQPALVLLGLGAALLHVWNHATMKGLLFLSAGAVLHATGTRDLTRLGGLAKTMPRTAASFTVGAVAIAGLPPLNGFVGELLLYVGLLRLVVGGAGMAWLEAALVAAVLALVGALAVAAFVQATGAAFLGEPRSEAGHHAHEPPRTMLAPMAVLAALVVLLGLGAALLAPWLELAAQAWGPEVSGHVRLLTLVPLVHVGAFGAGLLLLGGLLWLWLQRRIRLGGLAWSGTWDCGFARPTARMQYTPAGFGQWLVGLFRWVLRPRIEAPVPAGPLHKPTGFSRKVPDFLLDEVLVPGFRLCAMGLQRLRVLQAGRSEVYFVYMLVALVALLLWR